MGNAIRWLIMVQVFLLTMVSKVWAESAGDPQADVERYSTKMIAILKGPIAKVLAVVILLACVGALLRGRHKLAISCAIAFIVLLFLQMLS